jgi:hypothetical protein
MNQNLPAVYATLGVCAVVVLLIALGWRNRIRRQAAVAAPAAAPAQLSEPLAGADGQYVSTTTAGDWLDRIAVHGLGLKSNAQLGIHAEGVLFSRHGAPDVFIPAADLDGARLESGMAGKFVEKDGLLVLRWTLGDREVDTGFRPRRAADLKLLAAAAERLAAGEPPATNATTETNHPAVEKDNQ